MKHLARIVLAGVAAVALLNLPVVSADELVKIPQGTPVPLRFVEGLSSRTAVVGSTVHLMVAEDVYVGPKLVIRKDEPTSALIDSVQAPGGWGRSGRINLEFGSVKAVDGFPVELGAWDKSKERTRAGAAVATVGATMVLGPVGLAGGLFVRGSHVDIAEGFVTEAAVLWDTTVNPSVTNSQSVASAYGDIVPIAVRPVPRKDLLAMKRPAAQNVLPEPVVLTLPAPVETLDEPGQPVDPTPSLVTGRQLEPVQIPLDLPMPPKPVVRPLEPEYRPLTPAPTRIPEPVKVEPSPQKKDPEPAKPLRPVVVPIIEDVTDQ